MATATWVMAIAAIASLAVSVFTYITLNSQLSEMQGSNGQQNRLILANEKLASASNITAAAAGRSAETAAAALALGQQNTVRQFGAKVEFLRPRLVNVGANKAPGVNIDITATGAAANGGYWLSGINVLPAGSKVFTSGTCAQIAADKTAGRWRLISGTYLEKYASDPLTQPQIDSIKASKSAVYFTARICYGNGFGRTVYRDMCVLWAGESFPNSPGTYCPQGNGGTD